MPPREGPKCPVACNYCRLKKAKCNGVRPCSNCVNHRENCVFPPAPQRTRKKAGDGSKVLEDRLARMESIFSAAMNERVLNSSNMAQNDIFNIVDGPTPHVSSNHTPHATLHTPTSVQSVLDIDGPRTSPTPGTDTVRNTALEKEPCGDASAPDIGTGFPNWSSTTVNQDLVGSSYVPFTSDMSATMDQNARHTDVDAIQMPTPRTWAGESVVSPQISNSEHHGPASYLSICSNPAVKWISQMGRAPDFITSAKSFSLNTTRTLKLDRKLSAHRAPDPDADTARMYSNAYFQYSLERVFGVVDQKKFEERLEDHFTNGFKNDDAEWFALRNAVYATGCKVHMSQSSQSCSFEQAQEEAWKYFENALSVHTELLYMRSSLFAIQALVTMAFFTEGLGNPALEYMLISNAVRLAQSKGLHRQPVAAWKLQESEIQSRSWLFWVIYSYEKHISFRSGRPSAIDDDDISCELPRANIENNNKDLEFVLEVAKHAQIASSIAKELTSVKSSKESPDLLAQRARQLEKRLNTWRERTPPSLRQIIPFNTSMALSARLYHGLYLHFAYFGSLIAIHSIFAYPWYSSMHIGDHGPDLKEHFSTSAKTVVDASRQIVLATKYIDVSRPWPAWLVFFYPILGLINIFIYVLKYPNLPTIASDLALMDVVAGHFGYLAYHSASKLSFPFIDEIISIARAAVKRARDKDLFSPSHTIGCDEPVFSSLNSTESQILMSDETGDFGNLESSLESWPAFMPSISRVSSMAADYFMLENEFSLGV